MGVIFGKLGRPCRDVDDGWAGAEAAYNEAKGRADHDHTKHIYQRSYSVQISYS